MGLIILVRTKATENHSDITFRKIVPNKNSDKQLDNNYIILQRIKGNLSNKWRNIC